ncbi:hypothetical protein [Bacillus altitudinis]|uniref:DinB/UmuC family translesion DNA polymerase n=1 Tax=Bacillus altitudinis TaxID=293387 RepID=UPI000694B036|nr:hypothetical protein [Bacillus altitudinis]
MNHPDMKFLAVDVKSFYSSAAAIMMDLDPLTCYFAEAVASRARKADKAGRTVSLSIRRGFSRAKTIDQPTNVTMDIFRVCVALLDQFHSNGDEHHFISLAYFQ